MQNFIHYFYMPNHVLFKIRQLGVCHTFVTSFQKIFPHTIRIDFNSIFQHIIFQFTIRALQCLSVFCKSRRGKQRLFGFYRTAEGKNHFCRTISTDNFFFFYAFIFCNLFPKNAASHLGILCNMIQTADNRLFYAFRCSQRIQIR